MNHAVVLAVIWVISIVAFGNAQTPPSFIQSDIFTDPDSLPSVSVSYSDGLGRQLQTSLFLDDNKARVAGTVYDDAGRPWKSTAPFIAASMNYIADPVSAATGRGAVPYSEITYKSDPLDRQDMAGSPDEVTTANVTLALVGTHYSRTWYLATELGLNANADIDANGFILQANLTEAKLNAYESGIIGTGIDFSANGPTHFLTVSKDPNGKFVQTIQDIFGRTVSTCNMAGMMSANAFDILGNLLKEPPPHPVNWRQANDSKATLYQYNSAGQLMNKTTPDAGTVQYVYNKAGQLIASQNAKQAALETYMVYLYDDLGRNYAIGLNISAVVFTSIDPEATTWTLDDVTPANNQIDPRIRRIYDDPADLAACIGATYTPANLAANFCSINNTQGRLVAEIAYQSSPALVTPTAQGFYDNAAIDIYSYDKQGNVVAKIRRVPKMRDFTMFTYAYDLQDNTIAYKYAKNDKGVDPTMDNLQYRLDRHGKLVDVGAVPPGPGLPHHIVGNEYNDYGLVTRKVVGYDVYGATPASFSDYTYNIRNWLLSNSGARFSETEICYNKDGPTTTASFPQFNGNISAIKFMYNTSNNSDYGVLEYNYDDANRLTEAGSSNRSFTASEQFGYFNDGTINTKSRTSYLSSTSFNATYSYYANSNKLNKVSGYPGKETQNNYIYDPNGNMVLDYSKKMYIEYDWRDMPARFKFYDIMDKSILSAALSTPWQNLNVPALLTAKGSQLVSEVKMNYDAGGNRVMKREYKY